MSEVQRYSIERYKEVSVEVVSEEDGDFVSYTDYIQLEHHKRELIILVSALEQQKTELLQAIESALNKSTKGGWLYRIFENIIEKHNIKI